MYPLLIYIAGLVYGCLVSLTSPRSPADQSVPKLDVYTHMLFSVSGILKRAVCLELF